MKFGCFTDVTWNPFGGLSLVACIICDSNWLLSWQIQMNRSNGD